MAKPDNRKLASGSLPGAEIVRLLVGPDKREFAIHKKLLSTSSPFFRNSLGEVASVPSSPEEQQPPVDWRSSRASSPPNRILWLEEEDPETIELFVLWLYQRNSFRALLDQMMATVTVAPRPATQVKIETGRRALHWNLVKLHIFAAVINLPTLQDIAMDALQDLYLRCDWDISPRFVRFLYEDCAREQSFRLRKWAVAMSAWTLNNGGGDPCSFNDLFDQFPDLWDDYVKHMDKMVDSKANVRVKNPQLRLPANRLRNEERHFGFRQCSFHSHRASVGEARCPYMVEPPQVLSPVKDVSFEDMTVEIVLAAPLPPKASSRTMRMRSVSDSVMYTVPESSEET